MEQIRDQKRTVKSKLAHAAILLPVLSYIGFAQSASAQSASGVGRVEVEQGVQITKNDDLHFGNFIPGTVNSNFRVIATNGAMSQRTGDAVAIGGHNRASFTVTGIPSLRVRISSAQNRIDITRVGGTETMRVDRFRFNGPRNRFLDATTGEVTYLVGGQIRIGPNQAAGTYTGTFDVTVDYF